MTNPKRRSKKQKRRGRKKQKKICSLPLLKGGVFEHHVLKFLEEDDIEALFQVEELGSVFHISDHYCILHNEHLEPIGNERDSESESEENSEEDEDWCKWKHNNPLKNPTKCFGCYMTKKKFEECNECKKFEAWDCFQQCEDCDFRGCDDCAGSKIAISCTYCNNGPLCLLCNSSAFSCDTCGEIYCGNDEFDCAIHELTYTEGSHCMDCVQSITDAGGDTLEYDP